jgi:hypothetical protein
MQPDHPDVIYCKTVTQENLTGGKKPYHNTQHNINVIIIVADIQILSSWRISG